MSSAFPGDGDAPGLNGDAPDLGGRGALKVDFDQLGDGRLWLRVAGELDLATAESLDQALADALDSTDRVVLDLSELTFMDSSGLASIISGLKRASGRGAVVEVASPLPAQPHKLLELTGLITRLSFTPAAPRART